MWRIKITDADQQSTERELSAGQHIVGRLPDCDITINDPQVSRRHAEIVATEDALKIRDLGSGNGIHVNGSRVVEANIDAGVEVRVGGWSLTLVS